MRHVRIRVSPEHGRYEVDNHGTEHEAFADIKEGLLRGPLLLVARRGRRLVTGHRAAAGAR